MTKPHISPVVTAPSTVQVNYYTDARLECHVTGFPTPSIMWSLNDVTIYYAIKLSCVCNSGAGTVPFRFNGFLLVLRFHHQ